MFLVFEDSLKAWKKDLKTSGADMSLVKEWQKSFHKVKRYAPQLENQYIEVKKDLEIIAVLLEQTEQLLIASKTEGVSITEAQIEKRIKAISERLKKYQNVFCHEFFISKHDVEFHLTYETIVKLCQKQDRDTLILQSEVENLIALSKEALEKEWPAFRAMAFYYTKRSDAEIFDLPHSDKVAKVNRVYENEFLKPMRQILEPCYGKEKTKYILEVDLWN